MMCYAYPLGRCADTDDADTLEKHGGSVCVVNVAGKGYIALSGGGMDLTEDIVCAYALLGMLPR
jgi:hypothetical protein